MCYFRDSGHEGVGAVSGAESETVPANIATRSQTRVHFDMRRWYILKVQHCISRSIIVDGNGSALIEKETVLLPRLSNPLSYSLVGMTIESVESIT